MRDRQYAVKKGSARICLECRDAGVPVPECTFETGNKLKKHRRIRHPKSNIQKIKDRQLLRKFRTEAIVALRRGTT